MNTTNPTYRFVYKWRAFTYSLGITRIALLILSVGLFLLMAAQGQDIIIGLAERGVLVSQLFLLLASYWAISIWYWSRILLNIRFPDAPKATSAFNYWRFRLPRYLGTCAYAAVAIAILITLSGAPEHVTATLWLQFFTVLAWGGAFLFLISNRRKFSRFLGKLIEDKTGKSRLRGTIARALDAPRVIIDDREQRTAETFKDSMMDFIPVFGFVCIAGQLGLFLGSLLWPVGIGTLLGALNLILLWGASWQPIGSCITYVADKKGWPLVSGLIVLAILFSLWNDNHEIRHSETPLDTGNRPDLDTALKAWAEHHSSASAPVPFVVVATAGGGIRAAYWTATMLGELHDSLKHFDQYLFAISGVSGGSVGAAVYRALIDQSGAIPECRDPDNDTRLKGARACCQAILEKDFLGPAVAALLYPDFLQWFLPVPLLDDRGMAMETGWETAFEEVTGSKRFAQSMMRLYEAEGRVWPALFLNATWSENGRRLVASNIRLTNPIFPLAIDQLDTLQRDLRLSTAAHNSARFPAISPPGSWSVEGKKRGHLVDGGYFENFGAETALTILQRADQLLSNIHPVVILISSDPSLPESLAIPPQRPPIRFAHEIRGILTAFLRARDARGAEAASRLKKWADAPGRSFAYFRMCGIEENQGDIGQTGPPLGWALSETARDVINAYLPAGAKDAMCGNQESYRTIIEAFAGSGT